MTDPKRTPLSHYLLGGIAALLALNCSANAVQSTSAPNAAFITYSLAPGASTGNYKPPSLVGSHIMGTCTTAPDRGVGKVTLMSIPGTAILWIGTNSKSVGANSGKATDGYNGASGTPLVFIDNFETVFIETGTTKDTIRVHNTYPSATLSGNLTWIW